MSMPKNFRLWHSLILFFLLIIQMLLSSSKSDELQILLNLKSALNNSETNVFTSWTHQNSVCNFTGITCNANGFVKEINLPQNQLEGVLPFDSICQLQSLQKISMGENFLQGVISEDLKNCTNLQILELSWNSFSGQVPDFSSLHELKLLSLNMSGISGSFPWKSLQNLTNLEFLSLGYNPFSATSSFPVDVLRLNKLYWLDLTNCGIKGEIPEGISNLTLLKNLELSDNQLFGAIPAEIGKLSKLWQLNIYANLLTGKLPVGFGNLTSLANFDASWNNLEGGIMELRNLKQLASLRLFENQFSGELPEELGEFKFSKLRIFYLSRNSFSGSLSSEYFNHFEAMITTIGLSSNKLTGKIPESIGKLKSLTFFDLSHNCLTGSIPRSLANLTNLELLDLSSNRLSGRIPLRLIALTSLHVFNVAHNQLEGVIPQGKQFITFDKSSYEGNSRLCGFPWEECNSGETQRSTSSQQDDSESENGFGWKSVVMGYGCGIVFGLATGYIVFTTNKPAWLVRMVEAEAIQRRKRSKRNKRKSHGRRRN